MKNNQLDSKPKNRFTKMTMQLLDWLSHLELSGDQQGEQDVGPSSVQTCKCRSDLSKNKTYNHAVK